MTTAWNFAENTGLRAARSLVHPLCFSVMKQQVLGFSRLISQRPDTAAGASSLIAACEAVVPHLPTAPLPLPQTAEQAVRGLRHQLHRVPSRILRAGADGEHETGSMEAQVELMDAFAACC